MDSTAIETTVREVLAADDGPATLYLDGSLLEFLPDAATPRTVRFYPEPGETVRVRRASKLARALWDNPLRSLLPDAQARLLAAREAADEAGITLEFE